MKLLIISYYDTCKAASNRQRANTVSTSGLNLISSTFMQPCNRKQQQHTVSSLCMYIV